MKISKKVREEAILICAVAASDPSEYRTPYYLIAKHLDVSSASKDLASNAWAETLYSMFSGDSSWWDCAMDAEVECLLREGWSP